MEFFYSVEIKTCVFPLSLNKNSHYLLEKKKKERKKATVRLLSTDFLAPTFQTSEGLKKEVRVCGSVC